jgi:2-oxoglutarate dehydrogenase E2 component (dihydrolipoamide succinyltransferase)
MGIEEIRVPKLPESVTEATIVTWHKKPGDTVQQDENLVDIETDKVVLEVPAPYSGILTEILVDENETVTADVVLAHLDTSSSPLNHEPPGIMKREQFTAQTAQTAPEQPAEPHLSPSVRKLVAEKEVNVKQVEGTGKNGRITPQDVMRAAETAAEAVAEIVEEPMQPASPTNPRDERVPMTRIRARIAERLLEAQRNAAILTTFNEVDMSAIMELRNRHREEFEEKHGTRLGFMSFFVKASVEALKQYPVVNACIEESDIVYHHYFDIGIAVASPRGLVVPVIHGADRMDFATIERQIMGFGQKARDGSLTIDDLTGGTFSISNGGVFGSLLSAPIINPPQSALLGLHRIDQRPVARDDQVVIRPMMYLALSYDHRLIDGREAVKFLVCIKEHIEQPERLLLNL